MQYLDTDAIEVSEHGLPSENEMISPASSVSTPVIERKSTQTQNIEALENLLANSESSSSSDQSRKITKKPSAKFLSYNDSYYEESTPSPKLSIQTNINKSMPSPLKSSTPTEAQPSIRKSRSRTFSAAIEQYFPSSPVNSFFSLSGTTNAQSESPTYALGQNLDDYQNAVSSSSSGATNPKKTPSRKRSENALSSPVNSPVSSPTIQSASTIPQSSGHAKRASMSMSKFIDTFKLAGESRKPKSAPAYQVPEDFNPDLVDMQYYNPTTLSPSPMNMNNSPNVSTSLPKVDVGNMYRPKELHDIRMAKSMSMSEVYPPPSQKEINSAKIRYSDYSFGFPSPPIDPHRTNSLPEVTENQTMDQFFDPQQQQPTKHSKSRSRSFSRSKFTTSQLNEVLTVQNQSKAAEFEELLNESHTVKISLTPNYLRGEEAKTFVEAAAKSKKKLKNPLAIFSK
ncbi:hypothetical protein HK098_003001 [Nowakowskiella sp. JEL0407]|nr:hypothetical protein HK098_003001 [Nowakowskiella sp. JEL0407]